MNKLYLAHPISISTPDEVFEYYDEMTKILGRNFEVLSPMICKDHLRCGPELRSEGYGHPVSCNHAVFERDTWMVSQSDIVFCDFTGTTHTSIGCSMELAIASWLHKHTVVVLPDDNIHNHAFIREAADVIFKTEEEALHYLNNLGGNIR